MQDLFGYIYIFFRKRKALFVALMLAFVVLSAFLSSQLAFEEDISKMMPGNDEGQLATEIIENSGILDQMIFSVSLADTTLEAEPDLLINYTTRLISTIKNNVPDSSIAQLNYFYDAEAQIDIYNFIYENLAVFLQESDYRLLEERMDKARLLPMLRTELSLLSSPAGMLSRDFILKDPLSLTSLPLERLKSLRVDDNIDLFNNYYFTKDRKNLLFFLKSAYPSSETFENSRLIEQVDNAIAINNKAFSREIDTHYYGGVAVAVSNAQRIKKDIQISLGLALIVILAGLGFFFRRKRYMLLVLLPPLMGGMAAMAIIYLLYDRISAISLGVGSVLLGITIDYSLHIFSHYRHSLSVQNTIKEVWLPLLISCITSASAFLSLKMVDAPAINDLGVFAALSVFLAAIIALVLIPQALDRWPEKKHERTKNYYRFFNVFTTYDAHKNKILIGLVILLSLLFLFFAPGTSFKTELDDMNYLNPELAAARDQINSITGLSSSSVYILTKAKDSRQLLEDAAASDKILDSLADHKQIAASLNMSSFLIPLNEQEERINRWNTFWEDNYHDFNTNFNAAAVELGFRNDAFGGFFDKITAKQQSLPLDTLLANFSDISSLFYFQHDDDKYLLSIAKTQNADILRDALQNNKNTIILDKKSTTNSFIQLLKDNLSRLINICLLVVFIILLISLGRIELALVTIIPLILSWYWLAGIMAFSGMSFNIFNIIIVSFVFGLGIDYNIFILRGLQQELKTGISSLAVFKRSILLSVFTTVIGLGVMIFAKHPSLKSIAGVSVIGILSVVFIAFTLQPLLFRFLIARKTRLKKVPVTMTGILYAIYGYIYFFGFLISTTIVWSILYPLLPLKKSKKKILLHKAIYFVSRTTIYMMFMARKRIFFPPRHSFKKPAVIVSNHQSHIDIPLCLMFHPKTIVLTTDWVWYSPVIGSIVRMADFYPVSYGIDKLLPMLRERVKEGYSIFVFPEGHRSPDLEIKRFHKGAFYIADQLELDILPMVLHGTGLYIPKGEVFGLRSSISVRFLDRISYGDSRYREDGYKHAAKAIGQLIRHEHRNMLMEHYNVTGEHKDKLIKSFLYRGPVLEWYMKVKLRLEKNYESINRLIPYKSSILDLGCGYGFMSYMLHFSSPEREILGVDYDNDKINIARNAGNKGDKLNFVCHDIKGFIPEKAYDVIIMSDVLHYLLPEEQNHLLERLLLSMSKKGMLIIREGDRDLNDRHKITRYSEIFSTRSGFNKMVSPLHFLSGNELESLAVKHSMSFEVMDPHKKSSNILFVIRRQKKNDV